MSTRNSTPMDENKPLLGQNNNTTDADIDTDAREAAAAAAILEQHGISPSLRWVTNILSLLCVFLFSGIIFGWAPMELMLVREGQYNEICDDYNPDNEEIAEICPQQMIRLQAMFTVGQFLLSFVSLPVGWLVDHSPKTIYFICTTIIEVTGLLLFGISDSKTFDHFVLGYGLMALGGNMTMLGAFPSSFLLPHHQTGILAAVSCFFDASSIAFFIIHRLNIKLGWSRQSMFLLLACICVAAYTSLAICWRVLERKQWKDVLDKEKRGSTAKKQQQQDDDDDGDDDQMKNGNGKSNKSNHDGDDIITTIQQQSLWTQLKTREFALITAFSSIHMLRCNYYIMTVDDILRFIGDDGKYANIFSFVLPCGVVFVPVIEYTVSRIGVINTVHLVNLLGVLFGTFECIPILGLQIVTFGAFTCFRAFLYSTANSFIALYFGVETMGRVIGVTFTSAAILSLLQYPLAIVAGHGLWFEVNWTLLLVCVIPILQVVFYRETRHDEILSRRLSHVRSPTLTMPINMSERMSLRLEYEN